LLSLSMCPGTGIPFLGGVKQSLPAIHRQGIRHRNYHGFTAQRCQQNLSR
jgi:hypothetical protein